MIYPDLPEACYAKGPEDQVVILKAGEMGFRPLDYHVSAEIADEFIRRQNERLGVSPAQREAMKFGSMFGFNLPGASPSAHENAK
jgi:hypothetical protein